MIVLAQARTFIFFRHDIDSVLEYEDCDKLNREVMNDKDK